LANVGVLIEASYAPWRPNAPVPVNRVGMTAKNTVLVQLVSIVGFSFVCGMFFMQGFENWLQSNLLFWPQLLAVPFF
jgi:hypothetical protein